MSRGDQRERDRSKNLAKLAAKNKQQGSKGDPLKRNEDDKAKLQAKIAAKKAMKEAGESEPAAKAPVARKKVPKKKDDTLDDLLNSGLSATKKKAVRA